ncbi:putative bifunctional diguanylate cyclase/phosphodiesterase [Spirilliplanes yamanashiensis]|uniref:GGDEF-domain containing protein n=1 Tax=Spirilliplanes yamanashiensis TaxID=42233 RepID=A0A8J4DLG9_9ACTN|nr:EAL domain-containing protein [Spirilliplanes yamanashiensis]MDP9818780.1 diguanylate cyclase (GGDEF)-like protein [Spirilliplanes yamanashiensis]GIJ05234.1 GGDEF-domain containing protein [Spirilliplanes yamanashiensis]
MTVVLDGGVQLAAGLGAAAACWQATRSRPGPGDVWRRLILGGLAAWSAGQAVALGYDLADPGGDHVPSAADVGRLALPVCALLALLAIVGRAHRQPGGSPRRERVVLVLDTLLVSGSLLALTWSALLRPHLAEAGPAVAYPVLGVFLVVMVLLLLLTRPTPPPLRRNLALLGAGFLALAGADLVRVRELAAGGPGPAGTALAVAAVALLAVAVRLPEGADGPPARTHAAALLLPYVPVAATGAFIAVRAFAGRPLTAFEAYLGWLGLGLVVARQWLTIVDHSTLLARLAEGRLRFMHQAHHDPLTGLANRTLFKDRLAHAVERHRRQRLPVAVLFVDLDDFKQVNDQLGHAAGDRLLREVGDRLLGCVRRDDLVARLGGDEFAILIEGQAADVEPVGQRILAALREPFAIESRVVTVGASVGLVIPDDGDGDGLSADALMRRADTAMYAGKRRGKGALVRYAGGGRTDLDLPLLLARALADTPASSGFEVHYQPVVRLTDGATVAVEALARWRDPVAGVIDPDVFVIVAERTGMVAAIDDFVLDRACADAPLLAERHGTPVDLHVNVSAGRLGEPELERAVAAALRRHALDPHRLVLEITETRRIHDLTAAAAAATRLRALGVRLALDDFGSGFNALAQLHALPVDIVKLDASLTAVEREPDRAGALVRSVVAICAELRVAVVAEGIEREDQAGALARLGLDLGQGYLFGAPRPVDRGPAPIAPVPAPSPAAAPATEPA